MVSLVLTAVLLASPQQPDTATFRDAATAEVYARARVRHIRQDSLVSDYRATVRTRLEATAGRSRFARHVTLLAHESVAEIAWQKPNDLQVHVLGARAVAPVVRILQGFGSNVEDDVERDLRRDLVMDRPWFIPRALGDSIRLMGVPEHAALHPLADNAVDHYRFAITDSVEIVVPDRTIRTYKMRVEPKRLTTALVAGDMWIDADTGDIVRFGMVFLGDFLWETPDGETAADTARAREENATAERFLSVEAMVEYALVDQRYWMPYRQVLAITAEIPWLVNLAIPATAVTTFSDYRVNGNPRLVFATHDSAFAETDESSGVRVRAADGRGLESDSTLNSDSLRTARGYLRYGQWNQGRWEMNVPPGDSLEAFEWEAALQLVEDRNEADHVRSVFAELSALEEDLPASWVGRRRVQVAVEQVADIVRFNRVQGLSLGGGVQLRTGMRFTTVLANARFGLSDLRPTAALTLRRDGPVGRFDLAGFRTMREVEPWTSGLGIGNSLNALFVGNDDGEYYLASGGALAYTWNYGPLRNVHLRVGYEYQESVTVATSSAIAGLWGDGTFLPNRPVWEGGYLHGLLRRKDRVGFVQIDPGVELLAGSRGTAVRAWAGVSVPFTVSRFGGRLQARAAMVRGDSLPQLAVRVGGPQTVRGHDYGVRVGREGWAAQLDIAVARSRLLAPVVFVDIGDTFAADPLIGTGVGLSILNGLVRFNLSKGVRPDGDIRFDLLFRAPR